MNFTFTGKTRLLLCSLDLFVEVGHHTGTVVKTRLTNLIDLTEGRRKSKVNSTYTQLLAAILEDEHPPVEALSP